MRGVNDEVVAVGDGATVTVAQGFTAWIVDLDGDEYVRYCLGRGFHIGSVEHARNGQRPNCTLVRQVFTEMTEVVRSACNDHLSGRIVVGG